MGKNILTQRFVGCGDINVRWAHIIILQTLFPRGFRIAALQYS
jgi:hypothetical protein